MRFLCTLLVAVVLCCAVGRAQDPNRDPDGDGDGLSDFHERYKYLTDPQKKDSDGDGVGDGDWDERREYAYTVRTVVRVIPPCGRGALSDDYQDVRIRKDTDDFVELEVIHYPLATASGQISGRLDWRRGAGKLQEYVRPRVNTNWDAKMRHDLLKELKRAGIDVARLTDKEVVEKVSSWFVQSYRGYHMFNALHVHYPHGKVEVLPDRDSSFDREGGWTLAQQFERELLGRQMYYHKTRGTCTSSAMALTTVLRAVGVPTRMILSIPFVDGSDPEQVVAVRKTLRHHRVRDEAVRGVSRLGGAFTSHTFNEVFVGGRWHRLNYSRLGQPILDRRLFGMTTHVHTFNDLSEWGLQQTWGQWAARGIRSRSFAHNNP